MLLSQELSAEGVAEMVGKRFIEVQRPGAGPIRLEVGPVGRAGLVGLEVGLAREAGPMEEVETIGEAGPVGLEAGSVRRPGYAWPIHPSPSLRHILTQALWRAQGSPHFLEIGGSSCPPLKRAFCAPAAHLLQLLQCLHLPIAGHSSGGGPSY